MKFVFWFWMVYGLISIFARVWVCDVMDDLVHGGAKKGRPVRAT